MRLTFLTISFFLTSFFAQGQDQTLVGDCTVTFSITGNNATTNSNLKDAVKTFYIRGKLSRVDINSSAYQQSVIYNNATGEAVILQQVGTNKYMSHLTPEQWNQKNISYFGITFAFSGETKTILGYDCKKGTAMLKNGSSFTFYYAPGILPSATENPYQFKGIPGFVLQYEIAEKSNGSTMTFTYTASKIDFSPVPASKFDIPTAGYIVRDN